MIEDMMMRKMAKKIRADYIRCIKELAHFFGRSPGNQTLKVKIFRRRPNVSYRGNCMLSVKFSAGGLGELQSKGYWQVVGSVKLNCSRLNLPNLT